MKSVHVCKYCLCAEKDKSKLISPCNCKGTIKYVHKKCLEEWLENWETKNRWWTCSICGGSYQHKNKVSTTEEVIILLISAIVFITLFFICTTFLCMTLTIPDYPLFSLTQSDRLIRLKIACSDKILYEALQTVLVTILIIFCCRQINGYYFLILSFIIFLFKYIFYFSNKVDVILKLCFVFLISLELFLAIEVFIKKFYIKLFLLDTDLDDLL